jgi:hypothetical protein
MAIEILISCFSSLSRYLFQQHHCYHPQFLCELFFQYLSTIREPLLLFLLLFCHLKLVCVLSLNLDNYLKLKNLIDMYYIYLKKQCQHKKLNNLRYDF